MKSDILFVIMLSHLSWVVILYALLTLFRAPAVWGLTTKEKLGEKFSELEPRVSANLKNQFEWPLFFYVGTLLSYQIEKQNDAFLLFFAFVFLVGRLIHSYVQIMIPNVRFRGLVFTINFLAVIGIWCVLAI